MVRDAAAPEREPRADPSESPLFRGRFVRLAAFEPETDAPVFARWSNDSRYLLQSGDDPARPVDVAEARATIETWSKGWPETVGLALRALDDGRLVGFVRLYDIAWNHGTAMVGISVPDPADQDRGFGRDAMELLMRYAFGELGLHRLWLDVFGYNLRAIHLYEALGFRREGLLREQLYRDGRRWDVVLMGLLRAEWEAFHGGAMR
jgi:RimJ/RimL family protein N-acetyltransferase